MDPGNDRQPSDNYTDRLDDLMTNHRDAVHAAQNNDSLRRAITRLREPRARLFTNIASEAQRAE